MSLSQSIRKHTHVGTMVRMMLCVFLVLPSMLFAQEVVQEDGAPVTQQKTPDVVRVATVNVQDASVVQDGNNFTITFTLSNRIGTQPGIKYGVMLVENTSTGQVVVDHAVSDKVFTLGAGEKLERTILYTAPSVPQGSYGLLLVSENQYGFPFGMNFLGMFDIVHTENGVYAPPERCYLSLSSGEEAYQLQQGIDVGNDEMLQVHCVVQNTSGQEVTVTPSIYTHERSFLGSPVPMTHDTGTPITLQPHEEREVVVSLEKAVKPQSYSAVIRFGSQGNAVVARYVVRGGSGTLQNVLFDKSSYVEGETAQVTVFWTRSADSFEGARGGEGTELVTPTLGLALMSGGVSCTDMTSYPLNGSIEKILVPITNDCESFETTLSLSDGEQGALGAVSYRVPLPPSPQEKISTFVREEARTIVLVLASLIALGAVLVLLFYLWKYRGKSVGTNLGIVLVIMLGGFLTHAQEARADTFTALYKVDEVEGVYGGIYREVVYTVNLDKSEYAPGERMELTGSGNVQGECNNPCMDGLECRALGMWASAVDDTAIDPVYIIPYREGDDAGMIDALFYGSGALTAPNEVGPHSVTVTGVAAREEVAPLEYATEWPLYFSVVDAEVPPGGAIPQLSNPTHSAVTQTSARLGATIVSNGGSPILERGTCWGSIPNPTTNCTPEGGTAVGAFSHERTSLPPQETVYYSGYARNAVGTGYSSSNAFDTEVLPTVDLTVCTLGGTACVSNGGVKHIYAGEEVEVSWNSTDASSCTRLEGPSDFDVDRTSGEDKTITEPTFGNTQVFRVECTNGIPRESIVTVVTDGKGRCSPDEIDGCVLPELEDGESGGSCAPLYRGTCTYTCDAEGAGWVKNDNQCVTPEIVKFVICDKGKNDASCLEDKTVPPNTEVTVRWTSRNTDSCTEDTFGVGLPSSGARDVVSSVMADVTQNFRLICEKDGAPTYPDFATLRTTTNGPEITASQIRVPIGATIRLSWDTGNGDETSCSLSGGGIDSVETLSNGTGIPPNEAETGWTDVTISGRTVFTLRCGTMVDTVTVEVIPGAWED